MFLTIFAYIQTGISGALSSQEQKILTADISIAIVKETKPSAVSPQIDVKSAISIETDLQNPAKIIFEKDADLSLPIASLTKLMTAVVAIDNETLQGEQLQMMIVGSLNDSANALAKEKDNFVELMNQKAKDLGLENTFFEDPTGLSVNNVSTARDLAELAKYILKNYPEIAEISRIKELYVPGFGNIVNTDQLLQEFPQAICSKTGFTNDAKGCLLLVINNPQNNNYLINIILGADDRFSEMKKLINFSSASCN
jgi:D-alanyl-D-alanine carboxypeptidase